MFFHVFPVFCCQTVDATVFWWTLTIFFGQDPALKLVAERLAEAQKVCHQDGMYVFTCDVWYRFARIPFCFIVFYLFACIHIYIHIHILVMLFFFWYVFFSNSVPLYQDRDQSSMFNPLILPTWPIHVHVISMYIWISMYRYVYVYICIYIYICIYTYWHIYIYTYIYIHVYIHISMCIVHTIHTQWLL